MTRFNSSRRQFLRATTERQFYSPMYAYNINYDANSNSYSDASLPEVLGNLLGTVGVSAATAALGADQAKAAVERLRLEQAASAREAREANKKAKDFRAAAYPIAGIALAAALAGFLYYKYRSV